MRADGITALMGIGAGRCAAITSTSAPRASSSPAM
jgi:hypothetical protein